MESPFLQGLHRLVSNKMTLGFNLYAFPLQIESTIHPIPTLAMPPCNTRRRRAPNREPTSLAASTTVLGSIEAVDIDLALTNPPFSRHSTPPPAPPTPPILNEYPAFDTEFDVGYIYPSTIPPPQEREIT